MILTSEFLRGVATQSESLWRDVAGPLIAASVAALVAVLGYLYERRSKRNDDLRTLFSEALQAVAEYQELPYLVRRRSDQSPMTPAELIAKASSTQTQLDFFVARLNLESKPLGEAYSSLVQAVRLETGPQITEAWHEARVQTDDDVPLGVAYPRESGDRQKAACVEGMQRYLRKLLRRRAFGKTDEGSKAAD